MPVKAGGAEQLPKWIYDLVLDLINQELVHPQLLYTSGAFEGTRLYDWCPCTALKKVPAEVVEKARAIAGYLAEAADDEQPAESNLFGADHAPEHEHRDEDCMWPDEACIGHEPRTTNANPPTT